jgi:colanic acid/amylovoran biosynthesis glycosyltransferase
MRIGVITDFYPADYKGYYDTQFAQFVRDGHELTIMSLGDLGTASEAVRTFRLAEKVRRYPGSLRDTLRHAGRIAGQLFKRPRFSARAAAIAARQSGTARSRFTEWVRMLCLPETPQDFWLIQNLPVGTLFPWLGELLPSTPITLHFHGGEIPRFQKELPAHRVLATLRQCGIVFTNTQATKAQIIERGCESEKVVIMPVGFDLEVFRNRPPRVYRRDGKLRLVSACRLSEEKGIQFALRALADVVERGLSDLHYTIVGNGYMRRELERLVADLDLENRVTFRGVLSSEETIKELESADALLLPSVPVGRWVENQACVVQEALLAGTPAITSATGGVPESIPEELRSFSAPPGVPEALAHAIFTFAELSASEVAMLGASGRRWAETHYDVRLVNERLIDAVMTVNRRVEAAEQSSH